MNDDQLSRFLAESADAIALPPADLTSVARRGRNRRNRRRVGLVGSVAAVAVLAGSFAFRDTGEAPVESGLAATVTPTNLDWTTVSPEAGLGQARSSAVVDGVLYSLSTAPGPYQEGDAVRGTHLYRSVDGTEWARAALPDGLETSSLAAGDGALYAVGTAPAGGGGRDLVVAASRDGAASWSLVTLPAEVAALEQAHPGRIVVSQPSIASLDGGDVVASVVVSASPDVSIVDDLGGDISWEYSDTGIDVFDVADVENGATTSTMVRAAGESGGSDEEARYEAIGVPDHGDLVRSYTWAELGITPDLEPFIDGRTFVYASDDGQTFEPVEIPVQGWGAAVVAAPDGYRMFVAQTGDGQGTGAPQPTTAVLSSTDGHSWAQTDILAGSVSTVGLLGDRPAVATYGDHGAEVTVELDGGLWTALDLDGALPEGYWVADVAFGPMGMVASAIADGGGGDHIVHSADGSTLSAVSLADHVDLSDQSIIGLSVSADAIQVRLATVDGDAATVPVQQVLVGTPR